MGTPEWAIPSLEAVLECGTEISAVSHNRIDLLDGKEF